MRLQRFSVAALLFAAFSPNAFAYSLVGTQLQFDQPINVSKTERIYVGEWLVAPAGKDDKPASARKTCYVQLSNPAAVSSAVLSRGDRYQIVSQKHMKQGICGEAHLFGKNKKGSVDEVVYELNGPQPIQMVCTNTYARERFANARKRELYCNATMISAELNEGEARDFPRFRPGILPVYIPIDEQDNGTKPFVHIDFHPQSASQYHRHGAVRDASESSAE